MLIQCPFFFNLISTSLCLYLNTINIVSLPTLFNFSLYFREIKTFSIANVYSSFFFLAQNIPVVFFSKQPKPPSIQPTTFPNSKQFQIRICEFFFQHIQWSSKLCACLTYLISKTLFQNIFPNNNLKASLQGGTHKIPVCLVRH